MAFFPDYAWNRKWREAFEPRGLNEIQRKIVGDDAAERHADQNVLHEKYEYDERGEHAAGRGNRERLEEIFERHNRARPQTPSVSRESTRLRGSHANSDREIGGRRCWFDIREARSEALIVLKLHATRRATAEMLAHASVLG